MLIFLNNQQLNQSSITNTLTGFIDVTMNKVWVDKNNVEGLRSLSVDIHLHRASSGGASLYRTFELNGTVNRDINGAMNIHFNIRNNSGEHLGDGHYNKYNESRNVNFSISCSEEVRKELTEYAEITIEEVLNYFNEEK